MDASADNPQNPLPQGFSEEDAKPPMKPAEMRRQERMDTALNTWRQTGSIAKVKKALGLTGEGDRVANIWINRAIAEYDEDRNDRRARLFEMIDARYTRMLSTLLDEFDQGDRGRILEIDRLVDRLLKLHGAYPQREQQSRGDTYVVASGDVTIQQPPKDGKVVDARHPWEREDWVDGKEVVETPKQLPAQTEGPPDP